MPLRHDDYVIPDPPDWLPGLIRRWLADLIFDELHAMELGLVGLVVGIGAHILPEAAAAFTFAAIAIAFGLRRADPEGRIPWANRVLRREPWYFVVVFVVTAAMTYLGGGSFL